MKPTTLIIRTAGTNCDRELAHAFELAGARTQTIHLNRLIDEPGLIDGFDLIGFPGGFSYGDDIAAGRIFANRLRHRLLGPLCDAIKCGVPIIGICNGFQVLVKMGLLPDPPVPTEEPDAQHAHDALPTDDASDAPIEAKQLATLADNTSGRFTDCWVRVRVPEETVCLWTRGLDAFSLPIAHGEGRFVPASDELLHQWQQRGQVALRYAHDDNPNGSVADVAGVCDPTGRVLGLMPHPERCTHATHRPDWSRLAAEELAATPAGLAMFQNAVQHVLQRARNAESVTV